ncbi:phage tail tape measure protein [Methylobacterium gossipiicola]|uniref:Phage tail tape measure protein, lambda family n=1 Tax=Methylobacterium gossipiicola TaxID=582675 RepID=A0A1I2RRR7_9HYPH|nr:phage tail tape measure protein [Methylobacterium gossipiicola]SFG42793.1 phage tail tape measure protein, lambda family [Methylobacterium gossipiicola]
MAETETDRAQAGREKQLETLDRLAKRFGHSLSQALTGPLGAGRQLDGVLGTLTTKLSALAVKTALAPVKSGITGLVKSALSASVSGGSEAFARGGVIAGGRVQPFAAGGIVAAPTYFPMRGGTGLMGEAGPEAILPLKRGSDGRLGVAAGAAEARNASVTVNITTPDIAGFRRSEAQVAAGLARAVARGRRGL